MAVTLDFSTAGVKTGLIKGGKVLLYVLASGFLAIIAQDMTIIHNLLTWVANLIGSTGYVESAVALTLLTGAFNSILVVLKTWVTTQKQLINLQAEEAPNA